MEKTLINRVANSGIITINLENYFPEAGIVEIDLKEFLFQGLILREKDFRPALKEIDWQQYEGQIIACHCSTDAIIPVWAFMLVASHAQGIVTETFIGTRPEYIQQHYYNFLSKLDLSEYQDQRIVIKGCSDKPVPPSAYALLTQRVQSVAKKIMYGEPCSTVPIWKKPRI